jgi:hypothetical protein
MSPEVEEYFDIVRRSLQRGKRLAEMQIPPIVGNDKARDYVDIFVHCIDQLQRLKNELTKK